MTTTFQSIPLAVLSNFFNPCCDIPLDCDGIAQIITTILALSEIPHQGFVGQVIVSDLGIVAPHCWIELTSDQGNLFRVDYELKDWIPPELVPLVPVGFFNPENYPALTYKGNPVQHLIWPPALFPVVQTGIKPNAPKLPYQDLRSLLH